MKLTRLRPNESGLVNWPLLNSMRRSVVTVGTFDGMHKGHQAVVSRVVELARRTGSLSVVIMFDRRPGFVHSYAAKHNDVDPPQGLRDDERLMSVSQRLFELESMGVDHVLVVDYTLVFAAKSYRFFLGQLVGKLGMRTLVLGADATMGAGRSGGVKEIDRLSQATRLFELEVIHDLGPGQVRVPRVIRPQAPSADVVGDPRDPREDLDKADLRAWSKSNEAREARVWSSSNVRFLLANGCVRQADDVLGRPHAVEGTVVHGEQRGRTMGFPTANLGDDVEGYVPVDGVYAGWLVDLGPASVLRDLDADHMDAESSVMPERVDFVRERECRAFGSPYRWPAAISIGTKPTYRDEVGHIDRIIEPYAVTKDWLELYGHRVRVEFVAFLRAQIAFDGTEELTAAMQDYADRTLRITQG
ncbi:riboflavin kinase [Bifidobacterium bombi]|uniref:Riboflavin kinase n=1 Tax=Bifidobacterium bombi DSM 19703 TaxID=1341695 RepID=A0A080N2U2_9BIFI|nr:riboflavin kinase [Bifidobacterium bombi]KFF31342.1 riboflavin kinase [Bifidobacterium bombi DSM 19703]